MQVASKVRIGPGSLGKSQRLMRWWWLRCRMESTLMSTGAPQEAVNAIMARCAPLHHAASHPCSSILASQGNRKQSYETKTSRTFMSTNFRVSPPTVSTRERVPERRDLGSQANSEKRKKYLEKMAEQEKKLDDGKALPSAKDEDLVP